MPTSASDIRNRARRLVKVPSGDEYLIRRLSVAQLTKVFKGIPDVLELVDRVRKNPEVAEEAARHPEKLNAFYERMEETLRLGLLAPKIGTGDDEIELSDIPLADSMELFGQILNLSELSERAGETIRP